MKSRKLPAHPPEDYTGSVSDWITSLQSRGHTVDNTNYIDYWIDEKEWIEILDECEK